MIDSKIEMIVKSYLDTLMKLNVKVLEDARLNEPSVNLNALYSELTFAQASFLVQNLLLLSVQVGDIKFAEEVAKGILEDVTSKERLEEFKVASLKVKEVLHKVQTKEGKPDVFKFSIH